MNVGRFKLCDYINKKQWEETYYPGFVYRAEIHGPVERVRWSLGRRKRCCDSRCPDIVRELSTDELHRIQRLVEPYDNIVHLCSRPACSGDDACILYAVPPRVYDAVAKWEQRQRAEAARRSLREQEADEDSLWREEQRWNGLSTQERAACTARSDELDKKARASFAASGTPYAGAVYAHNRFGERLFNVPCDDKDVDLPEWNPQ